MLLFRHPLGLRHRFGPRRLLDLIKTGHASLGMPRLLRTTSFRMTLLYAGLFTVSVLLLLAVILWFSTAYIAEQIDRTVFNEIVEIVTETEGRGLQGLRDAVSPLAEKAPPGVYYLLQDNAGTVLAGNMPRVKPVLGVWTWAPPGTGKRIERAGRIVRGRGVPVAEGGYLFVGLDGFELGEMQETITRSFVVILAATIMLALAGGAVMSLGLQRRVEAISRTSRDIVAGDLGRRIAIRGTDDEFDHLAASLNAMLDRIESLMQGLREVSSDIAHDLRTPLSRLRQRLELARRRALSVETLHEALDASIADVDAILDTFGALLRIAQIEAHTKAAGFAELDMSEMLQAMVEAYQTVAEERGQMLAGDIEAGLWLVGDRELLPQLFSNLIENAIRHCPSGARIELAAHLRAGGIEVDVADDGPGIPADLTEKVLQRFFRLERSRTTPGTGLGLSLAAAIAGLHRTRLDLSDNRPGLRIRLLFPR
ncbi:MAG TPA: HAMP domain-containing sensor histidine kinase [Stellaceae bacterium]|nr:HAMP domain-containing sensor histidine kinase [Stellaceae bacterium]